MKEKTVIKTYRFKEWILEKAKEKAKEENRNETNMLETLIIRGLKS